MRHLTEHQAAAALRRGAGVEQMLSSDLRTGTFRWLAASHTRDGFTLRFHETVDDGTAEFLDVYEFRPAGEAEDEFGEGVLVGHFPDETSLLDAALTFGGRRDRWVNAGLIDDEYADLRALR